MEANTLAQSTALCEECRKEPSLYQCPGCCRRTCSLRCCRQHKRRLSCNGKRDRTSFRPLAHMDDRTMKSDYHFLEDVLKKVDGGKRLLRQVGVAAGPPQKIGQTNPVSSGAPMGTGDSSIGAPIHPMLHSKLRITQTDNVVDEPTTRIRERDPKRPRTVSSTTGPPNQHGAKWRRIVRQAEDRGTTLLLMPPGMERHKANSTFYQAKTDTLYWKVEICMSKHSTSSESQTSPHKMTASKVSEDTTLLEIVEAVISIESNVTSGSLTGTHFMLKRLPRPANKPLYVEIDLYSTLRAALKDMAVIEFPTLHVVSKSDLHRFPRFIQEASS